MEANGTFSDASKDLGSLLPNRRKAPEPPDSAWDRAQTDPLTQYCASHIDIVRFGETLSQYRASHRMRSGSSIQPISVPDNAQYGRGG
eukprot:3809072-Rhodomonas_salina.1